MTADNHHDPPCERSDAPIEAYLDGELAGHELERFEAHLGGCEACTHRLRVARAIQRELHALPQWDAPAEVIARIKQHARTDVAARQSSRFVAKSRRSSWLAAAAGLTIMFLAVFLWRSSAPQPELAVSTASVEQAEREARYALAMVARLTRKAGAEVRAELEPERFMAPVRRGIHRSIEGVARGEADGSSSSTGGTEI